MAAKKKIVLEFLVFAVLVAGTGEFLAAQWPSIIAFPPIHHVPQKAQSKPTPSIQPPVATSTLTQIKSSLYLGGQLRDPGEPAALWRANMAIREALFGNTAAARLDATAAVTLAAGSHDAEAQAALAYALAGDAAHAQSVSDDLAKRFPQDTIVQLVWLPTIRAQIETSRKNAARSIELLQAAAPYDFGMLSAAAMNSCSYPVYVRSEAYLGAQQGAAAVAEFQKILDHRGLLWNCATGPLAHLGLACASAIQGDTAKAKAAYQDFLTLWKDADPDVPILKQAKAEYAKLQ